MFAKVLGRRFFRMSIFDLLIMFRQLLDRQSLLKYPGPIWNSRTYPENASVHCRADAGGKRRTSRKKVRHDFSAHGST